MCYSYIEFSKENKRGLPHCTPAPRLVFILPIAPNHGNYTIKEAIIWWAVGAKVISGKTPKEPFELFLCAVI